MIFSKKALENFLYKSWPFFFFLFLLVVFFWKFFFKGLLPIPADIIVGAYYPWLDYKWEGYEVGVPVKNPLLSDVPSVIYPLRILAIDILKKGYFPLWNNNLFAGYPLFANFQSGVLNPFNLLFFIFDNGLSWSLEIIIQPILGMFFTYLLLREFKLSKHASVFGGIVYAFSGFNIIWLEYGIHAFVASMIPLVLWASYRVIVRERINYGFFLSLGIFLQIAFGYPQLTLYTVFLVAFWSTSLLFYYRKKFFYLLWVGIFGLLGILSAAVIIVPGYELLSLSQRVNEGLSVGKEFQFIIPWDLVRFFAPDFFGNPSTYNYWGFGGAVSYAHVSLYSGLIPFILANFYFLRILSGKRRNFEFLFFLFLFVLSLLLAIKNPLTEFIYSSSFLGLKSTGADRILVLVNLALAIMSSFGVEELVKSKKFFSKDFFRSFYLAFAVLGGLFLGSLFAILFSNHFLKEYGDFLEMSEILKNYTVGLRNLILPLFLFFALFFGVIFVKIFFPKKRVLFLTIFIYSLCIFELFRFGWKFLPFSPEVFLYPETPAIQKLRELTKKDNSRFWEADTIPMNMWLPYGLETLSGYDAVYPKNIARYISFLNTESLEAKEMGRYGSVDNANSVLFDIAGIRYSLSRLIDKKGLSSPDGDLSWRLDRNKFKKIFQDKNTAIVKNERALDRVMFFTDWDIVQGQDEALKRMVDSSFSPRKKLLLEKPPSFVKSETLGVQKSFEIEKIEYNPLGLSLEIVNSSPGLVFVSDTYFPGWEVLVNGQKGEILRANYAFRAVEVPAGKNNILFTYKPKSFRIGLIVSAISFLALVLFSFYGYKKNSRGIAQRCTF